MNTNRTDRVFKALADAKRRRILDLLAQKPRITGDLVRAFPTLSRFAVMKHLAVLQQAGLIVVSREGRQRWNSLNAVPLQEALGRWMGRQEEHWAAAALQLRDLAEASEGDAPETQE